MGNVKWSTRDEEKFLLNNVGGYEAAQAKPKPTSKLEKPPLAKFLDDFFLRWYLQFPDYSNGRNMTSKEANKKRIKQWFNNHTGARSKLKSKQQRVAKIHTSGKPPRDPFAHILLNGGAPRPKQKLQPKQAFAQMLEENGTPLKSDILGEWEVRTTAVPELKTMKGAYLSYYTRRIGELYEESTQEVKNQVQVFREEEHKKNKASSTPPPFLLAHEESLPDEEKTLLLQIRIAQRALENMQYACSAFASTINRLTNASVYINVVGPEPARGGALSVTSVSAGIRISDDKDFYQAYPELTQRVGVGDRA
ncbi:hypothetical protein SCHPADRAFT_947638 [Schizopora paradoxa]|uniref:Uncharacterized protein n=1 Tax=Schizopora paradoxa TaxID=27342 RepID=A0A0H2R4Z0_9AGAM|nr:hypothetical protein SCHPADRAFT_947638 [Schizopora paradoxa]